MEPQAARSVGGARTPCAPGRAGRWTRRRRPHGRALRLVLAILTLVVVLADAGVAAAATPPGAPTVTGAVAGNASVVLSWAPPSSTGGSAITGYVVIPYVGTTALTSRSFNSTATTQTVTGLTNGTSYRFRVRARNAVGVGPQSAFSAAVTPIGLPGVPTVGTAYAGNGSVVLSWSPPSSDGGSPINGYVVVPYVGSTALNSRTFGSALTTQTVTGLTNGTTYRFRVRARNAAGLGPQSALSAAVIPTASPPSIELFNGSSASFGSPGLTQPDVNIAGRVGPVGQIVSLTYSLNGGGPLPLGIGPDGRRLAQPGDFNVAFPAATLSPGSNTVTVRAVDGVGRVSTVAVTVTWTPGRTWPTTYTVNWSSVGNVHTVAAPIDGKWVVEGATVRTAQVGYDRLLAIGDGTWTSFEATVPVTVLGFDAGGYTTVNGGPGIGFVPHWIGHVPVDAKQPAWGFDGRFGGIAWYRDHRLAGKRLEVRDAGNALVATSARTLTLGVTYTFKMRSEVGSSGRRYLFKVWQTGTIEPSAWDLTSPLLAGGPSAGAFALVAHYADVRFGAVSVRPV